MVFLVFCVLFLYFC